jgi:hypothetical protein
MLFATLYLYVREWKSAHHQSDLHSVHQIDIPEYHRAGSSDSCKLLQVSFAAIILLIAMKSYFN